MHEHSRNMCVQAQCSCRSFHPTGGTSQVKNGMKRTLSVEKNGILHACAVDTPQCHTMYHKYFHLFNATFYTIPSILFLTLTR
jgi:hypothetical protein